ncbi:MAG: hypothetical protein HOC71_16110 [Candidatus Latescibacteria bacterium]|jgi:putative transposase|nr:hypothetical protein [Candidatus Latescibacterota bacterium]
MTNNLFKNKYRIPSTRLKEWDYSRNGYYFVTMCVKNRESVFGQFEHGEMILSDMGNIAEQCWREIPVHFPFVKLDEFVIMPNHVHGIIIIDNNVVETQNLASLHASLPRHSFSRHRKPNKFGPQSKNLASIIRGFKIGVKKWATINHIHLEWQSRFYDRIIRDEKELLNIRNYIIINPIRWDDDKENPDMKNKVIN